jgi:Transposase DDE domain/Transposase domain (DUF772)
VPLSPSEDHLGRRIKRAKLFVFLRQQRHELFDAAFQDELNTLYEESTLGPPPVPPARLALARLLQAYTGASDDEVIEATLLDRRWHLVLDCLDCPDPPCSKGTLVALRARLSAHDLDRRLSARTVEIGARTKGFGRRQLRGALDSSPLWGAGRVEDPLNLWGHALRKAVGLLARPQGRGLADIVAQAGAPVLGHSSLKAALDWDDPDAGVAALGQVRAALEAGEVYVAEHPPAPARAQVQERVAVAQVGRAQAVEERPDGRSALRQGVAPERRISIEDAALRQGRKNRSQRVDGDKRPVFTDLDAQVVRAVGLTAAKAPEASVSDAIQADLAHQQGTLSACPLDRADLSSGLVRDRPPELTICCKAWPVLPGPFFPKTAFVLDWDHQLIRCPNQVELPCAPGGTVHFPAQACASCPLRAACTGRPRGRSVTIHPDERLLQELRARQLTAAGRAKPRERVQVEHTLAHVGPWQGPRARYRGLRKNLFDLRRTAVVHNLHVLARLPEVPMAAYLSRGDYLTDVLAGAGAATTQPPPMSVELADPDAGAGRASARLCGAAASRVSCAARLRPGVFRPARWVGPQCWLKGLFQNQTRSDTDAAREPGLRGCRERLRFTGWRTPRPSPARPQSPRGCPSSGTLAPGTPGPRTHCKSFSL